MGKKYLVFIFFLSFVSYSQQVSNVKLDSANKNDVRVVQSGKDSSQKSDIDIQHSDSNKAQIYQTRQNTSKTEKKPSGFQKFISNTNNIVVLFISIATLIGIIWKAISSFKKRIQRK